jgi:AraC-like DNA-binding protein
MADLQRVELTTGGNVAGAVVARARGRVQPSTAPDLRHGLGKLLAEGAPVLLDVSGLQLDWAPAPELFVAAVSAAGGWPLARLVLFGAEAHAAERLRACRVTESVPLAGSVTDAAARIDARPERLSCGVDLPAEPASVPRALEVLRDACSRWGVPDRDDAATVVTELVTNAVEHAGTPLRLHLVLDRSGLRVSVRDGHPTAPDRHGRGLRSVIRLSRTWGVLHRGNGKVVWAQLPRSAAAHPSGAPVARLEVLPERRPAVQVAPVATAVTALRRRRFATVDPESAHAFLLGLYGEHILRLTAADDSSGFPLEYDGVTTNRFAIERLCHTAAFEGRFAPSERLVVVHLLDGDLRIETRHEEVRAAPGDLVVCDAGAGAAFAATRLDVEVVRLDPVAVARVVAEMTGYDGPTVPFDLSHAVSPAHAAHWRASVAHLRRDVLGNDAVMASPLARATVFRNLVAMLVETFPNPARDALHGGTATSGQVAPVALRRAMQYIDQHACDDIGLADIAAAAGIGARGLQLVFRRHLDLTPLEHLRRVRLDRAHRDLQAASPADSTVGAIADRWGFPHHGNFSALYLRTYGRSPSITLRS